MSIARIAPALLLAAAGLTACGDDPAPRYVLVHGAFLGPDGWSEVADDLRAGGAEVTTVTLPAHGDDPTAPGDATLAGYVDRVTAAVDAAGDDVVLVGHSMGGMVISGVAEARPDALRRLVYVAAYLPRSGQSLLDLAMTDADSQLGAHLTFREDGTIDVDPAAFPDVFCADCDADARAALIADYQAEPGAPLQTPVTLTDARFGAVPRTYVHTSADRVVSPALQAAMVDATPVDDEATLSTSHVPMLAAPAALADALRDAAE